MCTQNEIARVERSDYVSQNSMVDLKISQSETLENILNSEKYFHKTKYASFHNLKQKHIKLNI